MSEAKGNLALVGSTDYDDLAIPRMFEAEAGILTTMLFTPETVETVRTFLRPDDFFSESHRLIYAAMLTVFDREGVLNPVLICAQLKDDGLLDRAGNYSYVSSFYDGHVRFSNADSLAPQMRLIREASIRRRIMHWSGLLQAQAQDSAPLLEMIAAAEREIEGMRNDASVRRDDSIADVVDAVLEQLDQIEADQAPPGIRTGFADLDRAIHGYESGLLYVIAAGSNEGKTTFALQSILRSAKDTRSGEPVIGVVSLEMPKEKIVLRLLQLASGVPDERMRGGTMTKDDRRALLEAANEVTRIKIKVADPDRAIIDEVRSHAQDLKRSFGRVDMLIIDYVQMLKDDGPGSSRLNRATQLDYIAGDLKRVAMRSDCAVIALSQITDPKSLERGLNDLRDSRGITQAADCILMLTPGMSETERKDVAMVPYKLGVVKNRYGRKPEISLMFHSGIGSFGDYVGY